MSLLISQLVRVRIGTDARRRTRHWSVVHCRPWKRRCNLREEHLAQAIRRDVSDTQQNRLAESGLNPVCAFYRLFPILLQGSNV